MDNSGQGLAAQSGQNQELTVDQVVQLLMQGYKPEDLIAAGVSQELVQQAIQVIQSQMQQQQASGQGLAGQYVQADPGQGASGQPQDAGDPYSK